LHDGAVTRRLTPPPEALAQSARPASRRSPRAPALVLAALAAGAALAAARPARADDAPRAISPGDAAAAETLFEEGRLLMAKGRHAQACPKFVESYRLDPALGSLLNAATCHKAEGKTATAWSEFRDAEQQARRAGDTKRQKFAATKAAEIEPTLPKLIITILEPPAGTKVSRDGVALGDASLNTPLPVDPGEHTIRVEAPGFVAWETTVEAFAAKRASVVVPDLERAPPTAAAGGDGGDGAGDAPDAPGAPTSSGHDYRTAGLVIGGVGAASMAVGAIFAGMYFSAASECEGNAPAENCPSDDPLRDQMATRGTISGIALVAGGAAVVAGAILYFTSTPAPETPADETEAWLVPTFSAQGGGVSGGFTF
jgi:hypothetical protein